jgi:sorting and assembly machinery component 37
MCFARWKNWAEVIHPALATLYPIPQRYFVPNRIRNQHRQRLEVSGLWDLEDPEPVAKQSMKERAETLAQNTDKGTPQQKEEFKRAFEADKVGERLSRFESLETQDLPGERQSATHL